MCIRDSIIAMIIIVIIIIVVAITFLLTKPTVTYVDQTGFYNLDLLTDLNNPTIKCCIPPGETLANTTYIYDPVANITYSRQVPTNIHTVCNTFPNPGQCVSQNTDANGNIIPLVVYHSTPYYTFENDQFVGCPTVGDVYKRQI